ncbi:hypothetical protein EYF80_011176 [Liparis tanakae]|uniref:Secreted protein n=1 Tax=Liparis tanakae TaxID=230148 RepID=A0A4Z2ILB5_9TELE|nr:hypothetical protein EYF80_011176 [Liparis tanakae]
MQKPAQSASVLLYLSVIVIPPPETLGEPAKRRRRRSSVFVRAEKPKNFASRVDVKPAFATCNLYHHHPLALN